MVLFLCGSSLWEHNDFLVVDGELIKLLSSVTAVSPSKLSCKMARLDSFRSRDG